MPTNTLANPNILVAAEQPTEAMLLESMLNASGYVNVRVTTDGREIEPMHAKWPFQVLVLDLELSTVGLVETLIRLQDFIRSGRLSVVALAETYDGDLQSLALNAGAATIMTRPYSRTDLAQHIQDALSSRPGPRMGGHEWGALDRRLTSMW